MSALPFRIGTSTPDLNAVALFVVKSATMSPVGFHKFADRYGNGCFLGIDTLGAQERKISPYCY